MGRVKAWNHKDLKRHDKLPEYTNVKAWIKLLEKSPWAITELPSKFRTEKLGLIVVERDPRQLLYFDSNILTQEICDIAFNKSPQSYTMIPWKFRTEEMSMYVATSNIVHYRNMHITTAPIAIECLRNNWNEDAYFWITARCELEADETFMREIKRLKLILGPMEPKSLFSDYDIGMLYQHQLSIMKMNVTTGKNSIIRAMMQKGP